MPRAVGGVTPPACPVESGSYTVRARSVVVLFALGSDETLGAVRAVTSRRGENAMATREADSRIACWTRQTRSS